MAQLARSLNVFQLTFYGIGTMVGAGIYVLVGKVAGISGYHTMAAFAIAAWVVAFSAFSYGQLAALFPQAGGVALYVQKAFGLNWLSQVAGVGILLTGIVSAATLINGFYGYVGEFISVPMWASHLVVCAVLVYVSTRKVADSVNVVVAITMLELGGLLLVIGLTPSDPGLVEYSKFSLPAQGEWGAVIAGAFVAFYAFVGFEDMVNMAEETKNPRFAMKAAMAAALIITTILYMIVAYVALSALDIDFLSGSSAPFADMLTQRAPGWASVVSAISLVAISNGALVQILMGARLTYGMAQEGLLPAGLARLSAKQIPIRATLLIGLVILIMAVGLPLLTLAKITSSLILALFALVNVAAFKILREQRGPVWKVAVAAVGALSTLFLLFG